MTEPSQPRLSQSDALALFLQQLDERSRPTERICLIAVDLGPRCTLAELIAAIADLDSPPYVKGCVRIGHVGRHPAFDN